MITDFISAAVLVVVPSALWRYSVVARRNSIRDTHDHLRDAGRHHEVRGWNRDCVQCAGFCGKLVGRSEVPGFVQQLPCGNVLPCAVHPARAPSLLERITGDAA